MKKLFLLPFCLAAALSLSAQVDLDPSPPIPPVEHEMPKPEPVYTVVEQMPEFEGGQQALMNFISKHLVYPQNAIDREVQGKVLLRFVVTSNGSLKDIQVLRGVPDGEDLNREALRVIKLTEGKWKPGYQLGKPVNVTYTLPIVFHLQ